jgi:regulator of protease activity HflC (stomatin/prohibitin superfamily)
MANGSQSAGSPSRVVKLVVIGIIVLVLIILLWNSYTQVEQGQHAAVKFLGKYTRTLKPGPHFIIPFLEDVQKVNSEQLELINFGEDGTQTRNIDRRGVQTRDKDPRISNTTLEDYIFTGDLNLVHIIWNIQYVQDERNPDNLFQHDDWKNDPNWRDKIGEGGEPMVPSYFRQPCFSKIDFRNFSENFSKDVKAIEEYAIKNNELTCYQESSLQAIEQKVSNEAFLEIKRHARGSIYRQLYQIDNPIQTLKDLGQSVMRQVVGNSVLVDVLAITIIENAVRRKLDQLLIEYRSGVTVMNVKIDKTALPPEVQKAFEEAQTASQEAKMITAEGQQQLNTIKEEAKGEQVAMVREAQAVLAKATAEAKGDVARYSTMFHSYLKYGESHRKRLLYETINNGLINSNAAKYLLPDNSTNFFTLPDQMNTKKPTEEQKGATISTNTKDN